jgi:hypothetical protein
MRRPDENDDPDREVRRVLLFVARALQLICFLGLLAIGVFLFLCARGR